MVVAGPLIIDNPAQGRVNYFLSEPSFFNFVSVVPFIMIHDTFVIQPTLLSTQVLGTLFLGHSSAPVRPLYCCYLAFAQLFATPPYSNDCWIDSVLHFYTSSAVR
jgi:hypothetical protein